MKKITFIIACLAMFFCQGQVLNLTFDDASSINDWGTVADATNGAEASLAWNASGNGTGALEISGVNSDGNGGRAFIFEYRRNDFDYQGETDLEVSFDILLNANLVGTNLQFQSQVPITPAGVFSVNNDNIQNGVPLNTWTNLKYTITNASFDNSGNFFLIFFNIAAGADVNFGGTVLIDNVIVGPPPSGSCTDGIQNGDETGVDCGGSCPNSCPTETLTTVREYTFPDANSVTATQIQSTTPAGFVDLLELVDAATPDGSFAYSAIGNPTGALELTANNSTTNGRNFLFRVNDTSIDYGGESSLNVSFDIRRVGVLDGTAINLQIQVPSSTGPGAVIPINQNNLEATQGFGESYVNVSIDIDEANFDPTRNDLILDFSLAAGAFVGAGGTILIDNLIISTRATLSSDNFILNDLRVSPNPTNESWNIEGSNTVIDNVEVFDLLGKKVLNLNPNSQEVRIDASALKTGIYLAKFTSGGGTKTLKLVKN